jgi:hypothetical protein
MAIKDWRCFVPETLGLLLAITVVRGLLDASPPSASSMPHAFWVPVLLMAAQYGIMGGLFAACSASLFFFAAELPTQSAAQDFYDYAAFAAAQPCAWFAAALVLGGLRTLHIHKQTQLEARLEHTTAVAEELAERLTGAASEMGLFEQRLATDTTTTLVLLEAFANTDLSSHQALLTSFADVFRHGAGASSFAIYLQECDELLPRFGFEDGSPIPFAALASLPRPPSAPAGGGAGEAIADDTAADLPIRVPIGMSDAAKPIGLLVCTRIAPFQTPLIAKRRLNEVCRVLAKLLVVCPEAVAGASGA